MSDSTQLMRQWTILTMLGTRRYGATLIEMAQETKVNVRTIRRDIAFLQVLGFPFEETTVDRGRKLWKLSDPAKRPPLVFTLTEAISLYLGRRFLEPLAGTYLWEGAHAAFQKIRLYFGDSALRHLEKMAGAFHQTGVGRSDYSGKAETIDELMLGIEERRIVNLTYHSERSTEPVTYDVHPYGLIYHRGSLYLVAYAAEHQQVRHYKVDRVESAHATDLRFPAPDGFNLAEHLAGSFGVHRTDGAPVAVRVRFAAAVARYVEEKQWHPTQRLARQPDGSLVAEFQLTDLQELKSWLLSFGPKAVVLHPDSFRAEVLADLREALAAYTGGPSKPGAVLKRKEL